MKVVLAGAYGNLGAEIFKSLLKAGHEVVAADMMERDLGVTGNFTPQSTMRSWGMTGKGDDKTCKFNNYL